MSVNEKLTNDELADLVSGAIEAVAFGYNEEPFLKELYKYIPKDKVDQYIYEYDDEADEPRSDIFAYNEKEFVEKFRIDTAEKEIDL